MNILAFDTCFGACTAAVGIFAGPHPPRIVSFQEQMATGHAERLVPMIGEALAAAGLTPNAIDRIAVANGPGTFTGTRIAVSAARAFALACACPIVAISSLETIAHHHAISIEPERDLAVAMGANRGEVYYQLFDGRSRVAKCRPMLLAVDRAAALGGPAPVTAVGTGARSIAAAAAAAGYDVEARHSDVLASAGDILLAASLMTPLAEPLRPLYLRPPDAKPQDGKSLARSL
jgi:tRNA threonylcarbamoyladenosine biosynthesis protein TsaB